MTDTLVTPSHTIKIGGHTFVLDGAFATLRKVQEFFDKDILHVLTGVIHMRLDEIAHLIAIGAKKDADEIGQLIVDEIGSLDKDYNILKAHLTGWLHIAVTPKVDREKKVVEVQTMLTDLSTPSSPGPTTSDSPSAPSPGNPVSSGAATSGS